MQFDGRGKRTSTLSDSTVFNARMKNYTEDTMARAKLNPIFESVRGAIGGVVFKQYGERTVISRRPVFRNRRFSEAQLGAQERFRQATLYAKRLMADPRAREVYEKEAREKGKPILSLMIGDFLHATLQSPIAITTGRTEAANERPIPEEGNLCSLPRWVRTFGRMLHREEVGYGIKFEEVIACIKQANRLWVPGVSLSGGSHLKRNASKAGSMSSAVAVRELASICTIY